MLAERKISDLFSALNEIYQPSLYGTALVMSDQAIIFYPRTVHVAFAIFHLVTYVLDGYITLRSSEHPDSLIISL
jgi:hypothetical protein